MRYTPTQGFIQIVINDSYKIHKFLPAKQKKKEDNRQVYIDEHTGDKKTVNIASVWTQKKPPTIPLCWNAQTSKPMMAINDKNDRVAETLIFKTN